METDSFYACEAKAIKQAGASNIERAEFLENVCAKMSDEYIKGSRLWLNSGDGSR